jgi:archaellum component FlaF (FlaF/FlaG flagellin family)
MNIRILYCFLVLSLSGYNICAQTLRDNSSTATNSSIQNTVHIVPNFSEDKIEISFTISKQTLLNIKMTDILGNEPFSLFNESVAAGEFKRNFNLPIKLAKGLYFIKINAGNEVVIKRIAFQ